MEPGRQYVAATRLLDPASTILAEDISEPFVVTSSPPDAPSGPGGGTENIVTPDDQAQPGAIASDQPLPDQNTPTTQPDRTDQERSLIQSVGAFLKNIFASRATPTIIARSSFAALLILALIILWQTFKELRHARLIAILLKREKQTATDKDMFLQLSAHYLRTPMTIISAASEMLAARHNQHTEKLASITSLLREKIERLVTGVATDKQLQAIVSPDVASEQTRIHRRLLFWLPVATMVTFIVVANWLAVLIGGQAFASLAISEQLIVASIVVAVLYVALRARAMRRQRRRMLECQMQQRVELDRAKNQFVIDTYSLLESDLITLRELQRSLPADDKIVEMLNRGIHDLDSIVNKFKTLAMINTTALQTKTTTTSQLVDQSLRGVDEAMQKKQIKLERRDSLPEVITQDDVLLGSVVTSVLKNAIEYSKESGRIEIAAAKDRATARLHVRDHGPGFSRDPEELFALFARGSDTLQFDHEGMGLDLYLDRVVMRHLGGSISATNHPSGGANVTLSFPVTAK